MPSPRMRVFAGPNGSGKTTYLKQLLAEQRIQLGAYVNADDIEAALKSTHHIHFADYGLHLQQAEIQAFFKSSQFSPVKRQEPDLWTKITVVDNVLSTSAEIDSYLAADIAEMLRQQLLKEHRNFTYETVMSHPGKVAFMEAAKSAGYRVYLYFIGTQDPEINIDRVAVRVAQAGHAVAPETISKRYYKSMAQLKGAVGASTRAFLFDNSGDRARLLVQIDNGTDLIVNEPDAPMPHWATHYLLDA